MGHYCFCKGLRILPHCHAIVDVKSVESEFTTQSHTLYHCQHYVSLKRLSSILHDANHCLGNHVLINVTVKPRPAKLF